MADAELAILIKAVDEVTATMKKIEGTLEDSNKNIQKQTEKTSEAFDKQMGSILVLGQAANSVDRIFDSYQNMQLRVENASERVEGAQDRLKDAQYELNKVMKNGTATAEDIAQAQAKVESATRSLTIAQNRLEITNNQVIGTYIQIGMQSITLIKTLPTLIASIESLTVAGLAFVATPLGMTIVGITAAVVALNYAFGDTNTELVEGEINLQKLSDKELYTWLQTHKEDADKATESQKKFNEELQKTYDTLSKLLSDVMPGETAKNVEIAESDKRLADLKVRILNTRNEDKLESLQLELDAEKLTNEKLKAEYDADYRAKRDLGLARLNDINESNLTILAKEEEKNKVLAVLYSEDATTFKANLDDIASYHHDKWQEMENDLFSYISLLNQVGYINEMDISNGGQGTRTGGTTGGSFGGHGATGYWDFISRPGQEPIKFSSKDTLIGVKDIDSLKGRGVTIYINNINGLSGRDIAEQLQKELSKKISLG